MTNQVYQIYDRIFKRIFNMSSLSIINLVNALFGTHHATESEIVYLNKEFVGKTLDKRLADVLLQINGITYHLEAQMTKDNNIVLRVFEYGFYHAVEHMEDDNILRFPEPVIIYLDIETEVPEHSTLVIDFGAQGTFSYQVKNFIYQNHKMRVLNQRKMIILIPFQLLRLRKLIEKEPTLENFELLRNLVLGDIIESIKANLEVGNITEGDAVELKELTLKLYEHIYQHYEELGGYGDMKQLIEGAMELPLDKYRIQIDELKEEKEKAESDNRRMQEKMAQMEAENQRLKKQLEALNQK